MTKCFFYAIKLGDSKIKKSRLDEVLEKITIKLKEILKESPDFTGDIHFSFCLGGLTGIDKKEKIKIR